MDSRFEITEALAGEGGFGRIDKAKDLELGRDVAIKTLDPLFKGIETKDIERFKREAKILAALSHPNVPAIYDIDFKPEVKEFKLIYEWIEGMTLRKYLSDVGVLSLDLAKRYFGNICSALTHAHDKGIIHRDIKPSNLIITLDKENCYVVDFGISLTKVDVNRLTESSNPVGTPGYMSPEQEANQELDSSSDIFSLGIVLYECLCGTRPTIGEYKPLNAQNEAIPPSIDNLIRDAIAPIEKRIKTAETFHTRLMQALRPSTKLGATFSQGALHEIIASIESFNHLTFANIPPGQRVLLMTRLKTLLTSSEFQLRNPTAQFLCSLLKVCGRMSDTEIKLITKNSFVYGFEMKYGASWFGNPTIREELASLSLASEQRQHKILAEEVLVFTSDKILSEKEHWYLFDLKDIVQNLLANDLCEEGTAERLGQVLELVITECYSK